MLESGSLILGRIGVLETALPHSGPSYKSTPSMPMQARAGGYNGGVKFVALLLCASGLLLAQQGPERDGNFDIRFEPWAKLQAAVQVPFQITVKDPRNKPLTDAKVTLQIETLDHTHVKIFPAPAINPGTYMAKPVFPFAGEWSVHVEVRRDNEMTARTLQFSVPQ